MIGLLLHLESVFLVFLVLIGLLLHLEVFFVELLVLMGLYFRHPRHRLQQLLGVVQGKSPMGHHLFYIKGDLYVHPDLIRP